jgi:predicted MPP superfamily phosphohydrolase
MKNASIVIQFLSVALLIVYLAHCFIYFSLIKFFKIEARRIKFFLGLAFFLLPLSFAVSSVLIRLFQNIFANWLYYISGLWLGIATTLFFFFIFAWMFYGFLSLVRLPLDKKIVGGFALMAAILFSFYGIWNAYHPRVKEISVTIKNLPDQWKGKRVVQISDVHLGHVLGKYYFEKLIAQINAEKPEAVFITGDLFDGMGDGFEYVAEEINKINAPSGVYFVTGNHEVYFGIDKVYGFLEKSKIKILKNDLVNSEELQIIGINYPEKYSFDLQATIKEISGFDPAKPSVLLFHEPNYVSQAEQAGIDLALSGHTHGGQIFPGGIITNLIYHGRDRGLYVDDDFSQYTSVGAGVWGPTMRTAAAPEITVITLE